MPSKKQDPVFVILKETAWLEREEEKNLLGAVVKNYLNPTYAYLPELKSPRDYYQYPDFPGKSFSDFVLARKDDNESKAELMLKGIGSFKWLKDKEASLRLSGKHIYYKQMRQVPKYWAKLKEDPEFKEEVPKWLQSRWLGRQTSSPICLVTGLYFCQDVTVSTSESQDMALEAEVGAPLGTILEAASASSGLPPATAQTGDVNVMGGTGMRKMKYFAAKDKKHSIFALQVQIIKTDFFDKKATYLTEETPNAPQSRQLGTEKGGLPDIAGLELDDELEKVMGLDQSCPEDEGTLMGTSSMLLPL